MHTETQNEKKPVAAAKWLKRFGLAGFLFFFIKGLVWLALLVAATYFGLDFLN